MHKLTYVGMYLPGHNLCVSLQRLITGTKRGNGQIKILADTGQTHITVEQIIHCASWNIILPTLLPTSQIVDAHDLCTYSK